MSQSHLLAIQKNNKERETMSGVSVEEKQRIVRYFVLNSPPAQTTEVLNGEKYTKSERERCT